MRALIWTLRGVVFVALFGFALRNDMPVTVRYYLGYEWQAPLVLVLLAFTALGAGLGIAACLGVLIRQRRELTRRHGSDALPAESR